MAIPDFQSMMLPLMQIIADGQEHQMKDLTRTIADHFNLSEAERNQLLPIGKNKVVVNRVAWAKAYLGNAQLMETVRRGIVKITERGRKFLAQRPVKIDVALLKQFPEFEQFRKGGSSGKQDDTDAPQKDDSVVTKTPEEQIVTAYDELRSGLISELLEQIHCNSDSFFENLVVELLVAMGYGGTIEDAGKAVGRTGDGGIDGVIKEDKLGLDTLVIQAKRWKTNTVGAPDVRDFVGSMEGHHAHKGVFITTSTFSQPATEFAKKIQRRIVLIDGEQLANLMIDYGIGVSTYREYKLKKLDSDYFEENE